MSTRVGTLQAPRAGGSILLAAFLALFVMLTIAAVAISIDQGQQGETTFVGRHLVNTPSELSAGIVGGAEQESVAGAANNTQPKVQGGLPAQPYEPAVPSAAQKYGGVKPGSVDTTTGNTPTELSGGFIGDGLPAKFYDRHQRG